MLLSISFAFLEGVVDPIVSANAPGFKFGYIEAIECLSKGVSFVDRNVAFTAVNLFSLIPFKASKEIPITSNTTRIVGHAGAVLEGFREVKPRLRGSSTNSETGGGNRPVGTGGISIRAGRGLAIHVSTSGKRSRGFIFHGKESNSVVSSNIAVFLINGEQKGPVTVFGFGISAIEFR